MMSTSDHSGKQFTDMSSGITNKMFWMIVIHLSYITNNEEQAV